MEQEKFIGKYKILREIGKGGMAIVYKALESATQKTVALKVLLPSMIDASAVERFYREAQCMARLEHPNIIKVFDFGITKGNHYFAMEFIDGRTLKSIVKQSGPLAANEAMDIILQVGQALAYAHGKGMIHRDIKSGNIMVDKEGRAKVMDFGLVQIPEITRVTTEGSVVGTAEYMSPEQISDGEIDSRSDIYSLGITMYEILTGNPPFKADTYQAVLMKHKYELPPPMRGKAIPPELEMITFKALAKDVSQRYQHVQDMLDDIERFRGLQPKARPMTANLVKDDVKKTALSRSKKIFFILAPAFIIIALGLLFLPEVGKDFKFRLKPEKGLIEKTEESLKKLELADNYHSRGLEFYQGGLADMAIAEYRKAIALRADYPLYYQDLAAAYEAAGDLRRALEAWKDLLRYKPSPSQAEMARQNIERLR
ncbi:MAG: protein kinase [Candidatus Omnitrophica bacterium]|nr:protein kinase [Candidatus Omnitrophota bacterium]